MESAIKYIICHDIGYRIREYIQQNGISKNDFYEMLVDPDQFDNNNAENFDISTLDRILNGKTYKFSSETFISKTNAELFQSVMNIPKLKEFYFGNLTNRRELSRFFFVLFCDNLINKCKPQRISRNVKDYYLYFDQLCDSTHKIQYASLFKEYNTTQSPDLFLKKHLQFLYTNSKWSRYYHEIKSLNFSNINVFNLNSTLFFKKLYTDYRVSLPLLLDFLNFLTTQHNLDEASSDVLFTALTEFKIRQSPIAILYFTDNREHNICNIFIPAILNYWKLNHSIFEKMLEKEIYSKYEQLYKLFKTEQLQISINKNKYTQEDFLEKTKFAGSSSQDIIKLTNDIFDYVFQYTNPQLNEYGSIRDLFSNLRDPILQQIDSIKKSSSFLNVKDPTISCCISQIYSLIEKSDFPKDQNGKYI